MPNKIRLLNDPILRKRCEAVDVNNLQALHDLLTSMYDAMVEENGIGLAANQIGHSLRVFILKDELSYREFINPEIVSQDTEVDFESEACLSIPGTFGATKRYKNLTLKWVDKEGTNREETFQDLRAFAVQHEMDHLNGKLYIDQFKPVKRSMVVDRHKKYLKSIGRR